MSFFSNDFKFDMFMQYTCVDFWKIFKNEFSFVSLGQSFKKKIHVKIHFILEQLQHVIEFTCSYQLVAITKIHGEFTKNSI